MKIYLSGPMFGHPDDNLSAFSAAAVALRQQGHEVSSPREWSAVDLVPYGVLKAGMHQLLDCQALALLPSWQSSRGCLLEVCTAILCGLQVLDYQDGQLIAGAQPTMVEVAYLIQEQDRQFKMTGS